MDLLTELKDDLLSKDIPLSIALRKARVLADSLNDEGFTEWVKFEMNGYSPGSTEIPSYRVVNVPSIGHFVGGFGREIRNVTLPTINLSKEMQEFVDITVLYEGVAGLEALIASESKSLAVKWPPNLVALNQNKFYSEMDLVDAYKVIGKSMIVQILDSISNRLLEFVLSLRKKYPEYKTEEALQQIPKAEIRKVFKSHDSGSYAVNTNDDN